MSGIPVAGVGGLGLVAVALVMTSYYPEARWLLTIGLVAGTLLAVALVAYRRSHRPGPSGDDPTILFRSEPIAPPTSSTVDRPTHRRLETLTAAAR